MIAIGVNIGMYDDIEKGQALVTICNRMGEAEEELARRRAQMEQDLTFNGKQIPLREDLKETYVHMFSEEERYLKSAKIIP